jgi:hypothetical protein
MTTKSQAQVIAAHFSKPGATLTAFDALRLYGISRTAARIDELRRSGMAIETRMVPVIGRHGTARVAEYVLAKVGGGA